MSELPHRYDVEVVGLLASPAHRWDGRPDLALAAPVERTDLVEVRAGLGIVGDRYFGQAAHRDAAVTVLAIEALEAVAAELGVPPFDPVAARRTILTRGLDVEALRSREFALDSGDGAVRLGGGRPAAPCAGSPRWPKSWTSSSSPTRSTATWCTTRPRWCTARPSSRPSAPSSPPG